MNKIHYLKCVQGIILGTWLALGSTSTWASDLKSILRDALTHDPRLVEAQANVAIAEQQVKITQAEHWPIVSLNTTQVLSQKHEYRSNDRRSGVGLSGQVNLYSWGAVSASVARDQHKQDYYQYKYDETREQLGKEIATLYLTALRAKEQLAVLRSSLAQHDKTLANLKIIVQHDRGRRSEYTEAESRRLKVETDIAVQNRLLNTSLSQLSRYLPQRLSPESLHDPFAGLTPQQVKAQFGQMEQGYNPSYLAQQKELDSIKAKTQADAARRLPALNLLGSVTKDDYELYLGVDWKIFDPASRHTGQQNQYSQAAAQAKLDEMRLDLQEKIQTAEVEMQQHYQRMQLSGKQIKTLKQVIADYELQFKIARRSLIDILNAYQELATAQLNQVNASNDYRDAIMNFLIAQAQVARWAGIENGQDLRVAPNFFENKQ